MPFIRGFFYGLPRMVQDKGLKVGKPTQADHSANLFLDMSPAVTLAVTAQKKHVVGSTDLGPESLKFETSCLPAEHQHQR